MPVFFPQIKLIQTILKVVNTFDAGLSHACAVEVDSDDDTGLIKSTLPGRCQCGRDGGIAERKSQSGESKKKHSLNKYCA